MQESIDLKFIKSVSLSFATQIIIVLLGIVTSVITARYLGPSGRGIFAVLTNIVAVSMQIGHLGFPGANIYFLGKNKENPESIVSMSLIIGLLGGAIISVFVYLLFQAVPGIVKDVDTSLLIITLFSLPFLFVTSLFNSIVLGLRKYVPYNILLVLNKNLSLVKVAVILVILSLGIKELVLGTTIVSIIIFFMYLIYINKQSKISLKFNKNLFFDMWLYGRKSYLASTFGFLIIRSDIFLVNYFLGSFYTGLYAISVALIDLIYLLPGTIGTILFPTVAGGSPHNLTVRVFKYTLYLMSILSFFAFFLSKPLILLMYGTEFEGSVSPFLILLPGIIFLGLETIIMQDLAGRGFPRIAYIAPAISFAVNLFLNIIFIPTLKINGAAISSTICYGLIMLLILLYSSKAYNISLKNYFILGKEDFIFLKNIFRKKYKITL